MEFLRVLSSTATGHDASNTTALTEESHAAGEVHPGFDVDLSGGLLFALVALALGAFIRAINKFIPIPYTVLLLVSGSILAFLQRFVELGGLGVSIRTWINIEPHLVFFIFLPPLVFGSAFSVDPHIFFRQMGKVLILAVPAVGVATVLTALVAVYGMELGTWNAGMAFGAMLSATDPVAVVALLKELGAPKQLSLGIEGESLFNDGTAAAVFLLFAEAMKGEDGTAAEKAGFFFQLALGGPALGAVVGVIVAAWLSWQRWDSTTQITVTFIAAYTCFIVAEGMLHVSGVLAVVTLGLILSASGRTSIKDHEGMHHFWEQIEYFANTVVFVLAGLIVTDRGFLDPVIGWVDWLWLVALYVILHIVRAIAIAVFWPCLRRTGYSMGFREYAIMTYSGLRGAVGLVLALQVANSELLGEPEGSLAGHKFLFHMAGITVLTLLINGTTTGSLVKYLGVGAPTAGTIRMFQRAVAAVQHTYKTKATSMRSDEFFGSVDWDAVEGFLGPVLHELTAQAHEAGVEAAERRAAARATVLPMVGVPAARTAASATAGHTAPVSAKLGRHGHSATTLPPKTVRSASQMPRSLTCVGFFRYTGFEICQSWLCCYACCGSCCIQKTDDAALSGNLSAAARDRRRADLPGRRHPCAPCIRCLTIPCPGCCVTSDRVVGAQSGGVVKAPSSTLHKDKSSCQSICTSWICCSGTRDSDGSFSRRASRHRPDAATSGTIDALPVLSRDGVQRGLGTKTTPHTTKSGTVSPPRPALHRAPSLADALKAAASPGHVCDEESLKELRQRYLNMVKREYQQALQQGWLSPRAFEVLVEAASSAQDTLDEPLCEWRSVRKELDQGSWTGMLRRLVSCGDSEHVFANVAHEYEVCAGFIQGHLKTRPFLGIITEGAYRSVLEEEEDGIVREARVRLEGAMQEPAITRAIQTRHAIRVLIAKMKKRAHSLYEHGEIEEKEEETIVEELTSAWDEAEFATAIAVDDVSQLREAIFLNQLPVETIEALLAARAEVVTLPPGAVLLMAGKRVQACSVVLSGLVNVYLPHADPEASGPELRKTVVSACADEFPASPGGSLTSTGSARVTVAVHQQSNVTEGMVADARLLDACSKAKLVDTLSWGGVVGALAMLTGRAPKVTAVARTRMRVLRLRQKDVFPLMKSAVGPPGIPFRSVAPLEEALCKMAGLLLCELQMPVPFKGVSVVEIRQLLTHAQLFRPHPLRPVRIADAVLMITGALLRPAGEEGIAKAAKVQSWVAGRAAGAVFATSHSAHGSTAHRAHGQWKSHEAHPSIMSAVTPRRGLVLHTRDNSSVRSPAFADASMTAGRGGGRRFVMPSSSSSGNSGLGLSSAGASVSGPSVQSSSGGIDLTIVDETDEVVSPVSMPPVVVGVGLAAAAAAAAGSSGADGRDSPGDGVGTVEALSGSMRLPIDDFHTDQPAPGSDGMSDGSLSEGGSSMDGGSTIGADAEDAICVALDASAAELDDALQFQRDSPMPASLSGIGADAKASKPPPAAEAAAAAGVGVGVGSDEDVTPTPPKSPGGAVLASAAQDSDAAVARLAPVASSEPADRLITPVQLSRATVTREDHVEWELVKRASMVKDGLLAGADRTGEDGVAFDADYARKQEQARQVPSVFHNDTERIEMEPADFELEAAAVGGKMAAASPSGVMGEGGGGGVVLLEPDADAVRWFASGTRLLVVPMDIYHAVVRRAQKQAQVVRMEARAAKRLDHHFASQLRRHNAMTRKPAAAKARLQSFAHALGRMMTTTPEDGPHHDSSSFASGLSAARSADTTATRRRAPAAVSDEGDSVSAAAVSGFGSRPPEIEMA